MIYEWLQMLYEGNLIAWALFASVIGFMVVAVALVFLWWKMPRPAKRMLLNNLIGKHPIIANSYDDMSVRFETPRIFREGFFYDKKKGWHFSPRLTTDAAKDLSKGARQAITRAFRVLGTNSSFYLAYSGKGIVINPEIQALIEHEEVFNPKQKRKKRRNVQVPKQLLIETLQKMKDDMVMIKPVWTTQFLDARKIKEYMPKSITKSGLRSMEWKIREDERGKIGGLGTNAPIILMVVIVVVLQAISLLKLFNAF